MLLTEVFFFFSFTYIIRVSHSMTCLLFIQQRHLIVTLDYLAISSLRLLKVIFWCLVKHYPSFTLQHHQRKLLVNIRASDFIG